MSPYEFPLLHLRVLPPTSYLSLPRLRFAASDKIENREELRPGFH